MGLMPKVVGWNPVARTYMYDPGISPVFGYVWIEDRNSILEGCIYTPVVDFVSGGCKR